ncbi:MAG: lysophospholipid acyltransferase family protein [Nitrospiraceae bacterium]|nr:lysophospholipid acyltransferase family protein [Nitrospiraceae bacterium]
MGAQIGPIASQDIYRTQPNRPRSLFSRIFLSPAFTFYPQVFGIVAMNALRASRGKYGDAEWVSSSLDILSALENVGITVEMTGMDHIRKTAGPVVFIGNHMSTLETFVLPGVIQPVRPVAFVVKDSLLTHPLFGPVMRSRAPIVVGRVNPREDLRAVLEGGAGKLSSGISVVIFPQSTRSVVFRPEEFNSLGIKLASRAGVPVIPIALKTDAWGIGSRIKDIGRIDPSKKVHFAFGEAMTVASRGHDEHEQVVRFIRERLDRWEKEDADRK